MNGEEGKLCVSERPPIDKAPNGGRGNEIYLEKCNYRREKCHL